MSYLRPEGGEERVSLAYIWGKNIAGGRRVHAKAWGWDCVCCVHDIQREYSENWESSRG